MSAAMKKKRLRATRKKTRRNTKRNQPKPARQTMTNIARNNDDFPKWICDGFSRIQLQLSPIVGNHLEDCRAKFRSFSRKLNEFSKEIEMYEIKMNSLEELMLDFNHHFELLTHLCECWIGSWYSQHICKVRGYLCGLENSMETGNWLVACTCTRNIVEDVTHFDYYLRRIEKKFKKIIQLEENVRKIVRKEIEPTESWHKQYVECHLGIIAAVRKAVLGSNYDWDSYLDEIATALGVNRETLDMEINSPDKRTHIQKCIEDSQSHYSLPFVKHYSDLSERCHPNFGSNMLVISRTKKISEKYGAIWFSDRIKNYDGACCYFEVACEPTISAFSVGYANINKVMNIHLRFKELAKRSSSPINNFLRGVDG